MVCEPWVTPDDLDCCPGPLRDAADAEDWCLLASSVLYRASGRQWPGVCVDTIRPCAYPGPVQWLAYPQGGRRPISGPGLGGPVLGCGCWAHQALYLPHRPARRVTALTDGGNPLDVAGVRIVDNGWALRPEGWPCCQDLAGDGWSLSYEWGVRPGPVGRRMAARLACELIKSAHGQPCDLPARTTSVVREGISVELLDPQDFLSQGRTGLYDVDLWLAGVNPGRALRPTRAVGVARESRTHRVR